MAFYLDNMLRCTQAVLRAISAWVPRHMIGAVLVSLPTVSIFSHVTCNLLLSIQVRVALKDDWFRVTELCFCPC